MQPTEILKSEHRVIETVLDCLEKLANAATTSGVLDVKSANEILDFLATFADRCHHGKEEELLFKVLETKGFSPQAGPTGVMRSEHELGRTLMALMRKSLGVDVADQTAAVRRFVGAAREYVSLMREHIRKEDHCLFTMADQLLTADEQVRLGEQFEAFEGDPTMVGAHERCLNSARQLANRFGIQSSIATMSMSSCCGKHKSESVIAG